MADQTYTVNVADPKPRATDTTEPAKPASDKEAVEAEESKKILGARERYGIDRKQKELEWTESYKMYMSFVDQVLNPFLSNLFIPKTHEAVELLAAFLIGTNQSITASPENGSSDTKKALASSKWLDFLWRKVLKARLKILVFIKQGIVFGNGFLKVGWDATNNKPWMDTRPIEDIYFDYFEPELQDSEYVFDEIRRPLEDVQNDEKYNLTSDGTDESTGENKGELLRKSAVTGGPEFAFATNALFATYDKSVRASECKGKVLCLEVWCTRDNRLKTYIPTAMGWRKVRDTENPNYYNDKNGKKYFVPIVKLRFKVSPLPNRGYDTGAVYPTVKIQKSFNDLMREYFDSVVMINAPMWIKRKGARINPAELVRRPGGVITVTDINKDLKADSVGDVKTSMLDMLNRLDNEFQQASMVVNLLKGIGETDTATEATIGQENVQTLLDMVDKNIVDALSEVGQMVLAISINNYEGNAELKLFENDAEVGILNFAPKDIDGMHDIKVSPDRSNSTSKVIQQKQMLDFLAIISKDQNIQARYPNLTKKIYTRWLEEGGSGDPDYFFQEEGQPGQNPLLAAAAAAQGGAPQLPAATTARPQVAAVPPAVVA